ncbi:glutamate--cysteine ligase [Streptomyces vinaceus]|uniref:carboxylate-amine ligase n=1 Tax=Streptomyces vinaceus TaxID=1960 RepID=UPI003821CA37
MTSGTIPQPEGQCGLAAAGSAVGPAADPAVSGSPASPELLTFGIEEEYLLVDSGTLLLAPRGNQVRESAHALGLVTQPEGTLYQVEFATGVSRTADELRAEIVRARRLLTQAAHEHGCRLIAVGGPVMAPPDPLHLNFDTERRRRRGVLFGSMNDSLISCARHIHVGSLGPETGFPASNRLRPWIPTLLAMSTNSPFWAGRDTGHASWRTTAWGSWPSAGLPPHFTSLTHYRQAEQSLLDSGAALDRQMIYWDVRPSSTWPTVETRVTDVTPDVDTAVLLAALCRALVGRTTHLADRSAWPAVPDDLLKLARWRAGRDGLDGNGLSPFTGALTPATTLAWDLVELLTPELTATGDLDHVRATLDRLCREGTGAARQRAAYARRKRLEDVVHRLVYDTENPEG